VTLELVRTIPDELAVVLVWWVLAINDPETTGSKVACPTAMPAIVAPWQTHPHLRRRRNQLCDLCSQKGSSKFIAGAVDGVIVQESSKPQPTLIEELIPGFLGCQ